MRKESALQKKKEELYSHIHLSIGTLDIIIALSFMALAAVILFGME